MSAGKTKDAAVAEVEMVNIEIDGVPLEAPKGSMIIEASDKAGIEIPRFCYHPKLSIAANCRMCLVDVEKAPKPLPACATPVMEGMKVYTQSRRAMDAQHGVMEFLLINHPLDCPICDQGGECELQDLAMGYGRSVSRFTERKRVVRDKNVGALIQTDMTRCIHCTRCVRFLEEIAGTAEMGGAGRGDRLEIGTCVETSIDSEMSGNIIDLCPVGALTNKPFRFAARAWELVAKPSIAAHDGIGSHLYHHLRRGQILRTVPRENESLNEGWLPDRDRYSHLGLYADDRVLAPQLRKNGEWQTVSWDEAVQETCRILESSRGDEGPGGPNFLMSPSAATEEYFLAQQLARSLGSANIDHRLRERDFSDDPARAAGPRFEMKISQTESADAVLLVGSNPRHEAPILGHRLRQAWRAGATISAINPVAWEFVFDIDQNIVTAPQQMAAEAASVAAAVRHAGGREAPESIRSALDAAVPEARHEAIARNLLDAESGLVLVGQFSMSHMDAAWLRQLSAYIAEATGSALNLLPHGGNSPGAWLAGAVPHRGVGGAPVETGLNAADMLEESGKTWLLWGFEPDFDADDPGRFMAALAAANRVIAVAEFATGSLREVADVILPLAPLAESEGSLVNLDGDSLTFSPAGAASGDARPGWKILRRLGSELGLEGFQQVDIGQVRDELQSRLDQNAGAEAAECRLAAPGDRTGLFRIGDVPIYSVDALCRRSDALQQTVHAGSGLVGMNPGDAARLGLIDGGKARVKQGDNHVELEVAVSDRVPPGAAWVRSGTCSTTALGPAVGPISVEVA